MAYVSKAVSDLVLAIIVAWAIFQITSKAWDTYLFALIGFAIVWCAALLGMIRHGLRNPPDGIVKIHDYFHWLSLTSAVCCVAAEVVKQQGVEGFDVISLVLIGIAGVHGLITYFLDSDVKHWVDDVVLIGSLATILFFSLFAKSLFGTLGCAVLLGVRMGSSDNIFQMCDYYEMIRWGQAGGVYCFYRFLTSDVQYTVLQD